MHVCLVSSLEALNLCVSPELFASVCVQVSETCF